MPSPRILRAEYPRHLPKPYALSPYRVWSCPHTGPFFGHHKRAVYEALVPADFFGVVELVEKGPPQIEQDTGLGPLAQSPMHGTLGAIPLGQFAPWSPCP